MDTSPPPIVFKSPGLKNDTRLLAFYQEFQVHSSVLKLHSTFFRKFMDSPEKNLVVQDGFQYNYATQIDLDGMGWTLFPTNDYVSYKDPDLTFPQLDRTVDIEWEPQCFEALLRAFYVMPYPFQVEYFWKLESLTTMADYYSCLPIISRTLTNSMFEIDCKITWYEEMEKDSESFLKLAIRLRNSTLFRDALIMHVAKWDAQKNFHSIWRDNRDILKIVKNVQNQIASSVAKVLKLGFEGKPGAEELLRLHRAIATDALGDYALPKHMRLIMEDPTLEHSPLVKEIRPAMDKLLYCNLAFGSNCVAGSAEYSHHFLCAEIRDDDLPWDTSEVNF